MSDTAGLTIEVVCSRCEREMVVTFDYPLLDNEWVCDACWPADEAP